MSTWTNNILKQFWHATAKAPRAFPGAHIYGAGLEVLGGGLGISQPLSTVIMPKKGTTRSTSSTVAAPPPGSGGTQPSTVKLNIQPATVTTPAAPAPTAPAAPAAPAIDPTAFQSAGAIHDTAKDARAAAQDAAYAAQQLSATAPGSPQAQQAATNAQVLAAQAAAANAAALSATGQHAEAAGEAARAVAITNQLQQQAGPGGFNPGSAGGGGGGGGSDDDGGSDGGGGGDDSPPMDMPEQSDAVQQFRQGVDPFDQGDQSPAPAEEQATAPDQEYDQGYPQDDSMTVDSSDQEQVTGMDKDEFHDAFFGDERLHGGERLRAKRRAVTGHDAMGYGDGGAEWEILDEPADPQRGMASKHSGAAYLQDVTYPRGGASSGQEGGVPMRPEETLEVYGSDDIVYGADKIRARRAQRRAEAAKGDIDVFGAGGEDASAGVKATEPPPGYARGGMPGKGPGKLTHRPFFSALKSFLKPHPKHGMTEVDGAYGRGLEVLGSEDVFGAAAVKPGSARVNPRTEAAAVKSVGNQKLWIRHQPAQSNVHPVKAAIAKATNAAENANLAAKAGVSAAAKHVAATKLKGATETLLGYKDITVGAAALTAKQKSAVAKRDAAVKKQTDAVAAVKKKSDAASAAAAKAVDTVKKQKAVIAKHTYGHVLGAMDLFGDDTSTATADASTSIDETDPKILWSQPPADAVVRDKALGWDRYSKGSVTYFTGPKNANGGQFGFAWGYDHMNWPNSGDPMRWILRNGQEGSNQSQVAAGMLIPFNGLFAMVQGIMGNDNWSDGYPDDKTAALKSASMNFGPLIGNPANPDYAGLRYAKDADVWFWPMASAPSWATAEINAATKALADAATKAQAAADAAAQAVADKAAADAAAAQAQQDAANALAESQAQSEANVAAMQQQTQAAQLDIDERKSALAQAQAAPSDDGGDSGDAGAAAVAQFRQTGTSPLDDEDQGAAADQDQGAADETMGPSESDEG